MYHCKSRVFSRKEKRMRTTAVLTVILLQFMAVVEVLPASEYLGNNQRTGYTDAAVPAKPALLWTYQERHAPRKSWPEPYGELQFIDFDYTDQITVGLGMAFFGSSADHTIRSLDYNTGAEKWAFYTEGPVRFAPVLHKDRVYAASDDGHIYCLRASGGSLIWNLRLAPGNERCIGNEQMVSKWPCRSGILIEGDKLYATAGMWSRDGVFIYCLNADTGKTIWKNDTTAFRWMSLPHGAGYGGVAPQGPLALYKDTLYVAAGRSAPAIFDAKSGELLFHEIGVGYKPHYPGGSWVMASHDWIVFKRQHNYRDADVEFKEYEIGENIEGVIMYNYRTGNPEMALTSGKVLAAVRGDDMILAGDGPVISVNIKKMRTEYSTHEETKNRLAVRPKYMDPTPLADWKTDIGRVYSLLIAGNTVIAGGRGVVTLLDAAGGRNLWHREVQGNVHGITASDGKFIVTTTSGYLYCFGKGSFDSTNIISHKPVAPTISDDAKESASKVIEEVGINEGYCLMLGAGDGGLLFELLKNTSLVVYCLEPNPEKRNKIQALLDRAGLLGTRAQLHSGSFDDISYAPYVANCIVWGSRLGSDSEETDLKGLYRSLRPWGGKAYEYGDESVASASGAALTQSGVPQEEVTAGSFGAVVKRGPLPGAGEWTRAHANTGNTLSSEDEIVELPLGILWWGGVGPSRIVSRHWRAPVPLFSKGYMFIQGQHDIIGVDAYNGREMWNRHIEDVGRFPPAFRGGNIITDGDRVYCVSQLVCYALDAKTGTTVQEYRHILSPEQKAEMEKLVPLQGILSGKAKDGLERLVKPTIVWEYLGMAGGRIIGTLGYDAANLKHTGMAIPNQSRYIFAYDKASGSKAWEITLDNTISPSAIVSDDTCLYFIDRTDEWTYENAKRKGNLAGFSSVLKAVRLSDGNTVWTNKELAPQRKALFLKDGVIVASANFSDVAEDSTSGLSAFSAENGALLWERENARATSRRGGPVRHIFIVGDTLYTPTPVDLRTGQDKLTYADPLTAAPSQFKLSGQNFCGTIAAGKHIVAYRSAGLGFRSLTDSSPSFWLPEKRTSCWISLLPAGGLLLAPEGTSTCVCSYNYKTSLALVPVERLEDWGVYLTGYELPQRGIEPGGTTRKNQKIKQPPRATTFSRLNLNLNAPGDRLDKERGPFLAWPEVVPYIGDWPKLHLPVEGGEKSEGFRFNTDYHPVAGTNRPWIYTSGLTGELDLKITTEGQKTCRIVLHFMEPEQVQGGGRVFDVLVNGKRVLSQVDIVKETGAPNEALVKQVKGVSLSPTVEVSLRRASGKPPLLCGIEIIPE